MGSHDNADLFKQSSLRILGSSSIEAISAKLDRRRVLQSESGKCRDFRGLVEDQDAVLKSDRPTVELIKRWCRNDGVTVGSLLAGLATVGRFDVVEDTEAQLAADCERVMTQVAAAPGATTSFDLRMDEDLLTLQDLECRQAGRPLVKFDAMLVYGDDDEDVAFADHLRERLEAARLQVYDPKTDLLAGTMEQSASVRLIHERVSKVILICTPSFFRSRESTFLRRVAQYEAVNQNKNILLPIMFKKCPDLKDDCPELNMVFKLAYDSRRRTVNFYKRLIVDTMGVKVDGLSQTIFAYDERFGGPTSTTHAASAPQLGAFAAAPPIAHPNSQQQLNTTSSVRSDVSNSFSDLNTVSTTVSELSMDTELLRRMPNVPNTALPGDSSSAISVDGATAGAAPAETEKKSKSKSGGIFRGIKKAVKTKTQQSRQYVAM